MASELKVDKFTGVTTAGSISVTGEGNSTTTNLQQGLAKSWVNFDGTASGAASRDTFNVSGMTDVATGQYTVSYSTSMANVNYAISCTTVDGGTATRGGNTLNLMDGTTPQTGSISVESRFGGYPSSNGGEGDQDFMFVIVFGDLA